MIGQTITFYDKSGAHRRRILKETTKDGQRQYIMRNLDNLESDQIFGNADIIDRMFGSEKGEIRKSKYTDRPFQKSKVKAGGF